MKTKAAESATAEVRQSLKTEHDRAEALASELATSRTTIYAYEAQARKASDQTADLKQAAESADSGASRKWVGELSKYLDRVEVVSD